MAITAKRVSPDGSVEDVHLNDNPDNMDLINALGGRGDIVTLGWIFSWEILKTTEGEDILVVGAPPFIDVLNPRRQTCDFGDQKARDVIRALNFLTHASTCPQGTLDPKG